RVRNWLTLPLLAVLMLFLLPDCSRGAIPKVGELRLDLRLDPADHSLSGTATVQLPPGEQGPLELALASQAKIRRVTAGGQELAFQQNGARLTVALLVRSKETALLVDYACRFADPVPERIVSFEDPSYGVEATISEQGTFLGGGADWYPRPASGPSRIVLTMAAPAGTEVLTEGVRSSHQASAAGTTVTWQIDRPLQPLSLSAGPYQISERQLGKTTLYTYFYRDNAPLADRYLTKAAEYLQLYEQLFGPYPFAKFAIVENFLPTGYGFPSYTLLGSGVIRLPFILETSLPHEIAHCWWGNGVLVDQRQGNWSEGLVTYLADHYLLELKSPEEAREYRQRLLNDYATLVTPATDFPLNSFGSRTDPASRAIGYGKAAMVFHMVRVMVGDGPFFKALREVYRERLFTAASWDDFARAFGAAAEIDLTGFIRQWLTTTGAPHLKFGRVGLAGTEPPWTITGTINLTPPAYSLPVRVVLYTEEEVIGQWVMVNGEKTPFAFGAGDQPHQVRIDPEVNIFRLVPSAELPATVNRLKGAKELTVILAAGRQQDEPLRTLLESLGRSGARVVSEQSLGGKFPAGNILCYGLPRDRSLFAALPAGTSVAADSFSVNGELFNQPDDALLLVTTRADSPEQVAGLFLPLSPAAATTSAPKITHYGRFGSLVFRKGENRHKGTVAPLKSELRYELPGKGMP
ncbi:MAG TPA: M1 family aminopeptidase, partial [Geobacteraceae bacterium]